MRIRRHLRLLPTTILEQYSNMAHEPATKKRRLSPPDEDAAPGFAKWNLEQDYERRARKGKKDDNKKQKLPIKTAEGEIVQQAIEPEVDGDADSFLASDDEVDSGVVDVQAKPEEPKAPKLSNKEQIIQAKEELARIASLMSENPEDHVGLLGALTEIGSSHNVVVKKLGLGTQLAVYKDIIPGYRVRPLSKEEMAGKLSKDVKKLRSFEQSLLSGYKGYVKALEKLAKGSASRDETAAGLASVAISCACNLLESVPHFNCRNELLGILIGKLSARASRADQDFARCLKTLEHIFREDEDGHLSLEAVAQLTKMMKSRSYHFHESVLNTFLHLRLLNEFSGSASNSRVDRANDRDAQPQQKLSKSKREYRSKRERKIVKEKKAVEKEFKEADAVVSHEERDKNQAEMLKLVFVAYFRILKARVEHLMGAVLEGLARYAHLINQDFFGDVLEVLKDLIAEANASSELDAALDDPDLTTDQTSRNATRESLLAITTAFALLQGQVDVAKSASSLNLDLNFFIQHLYTLLLPLSLDPDIELSAKTAHFRDPNNLPTPGQGTKVNVATTTVLLLRSLSAVLLPPTGTKSVPPLRVAAYVKQILSASLHLPQKSAVACVGLLQQISKTHTGKIASLWNTEERKGDGVFDPLSALEGANPMAATVWEGEVLRWHFDPRVRDTIKAVERTVRER